MQYAVIHLRNMILKNLKTGFHVLSVDGRSILIVLGSKKVGEAIGLLSVLNMVWNILLKAAGHRKRCKDLGDEEQDGFCR